MARTSAQDDAGPPVTGLTALREAENTCRRCPLYKNATQAAPGQGPRHAALMLVGEQPGDKEDLVSQPFVGPAGRLLDSALEEAEIPRSETFVTNAVKHFMHEMRGKRRLHKRPNAYEVDRCRWWLTQERAIVRPQAIVALGATAARSLFGRPVAIGNSRGRELTTKDGIMVFVTIHPSMLLRIREQPDREREYQAFVGDLQRAAAYLHKHKATGIAASLPRRTRLQPIWSVPR